MQQPRTMRSVITLILMAFTVSLAACGFHLRGESKMHTSFSHLAVQGMEGEEFRQTLVSNLEKSGVKIKKNSPYAIVLLDTESERRVSAYSTRAKSAGFELKRTVIFKILPRGQKEESIAESELFSRRHLLLREDQVVGKQDEEMMLWKEMDQELVQRILRKLESVQTEKKS